MELLYSSSVDEIAVLKPLWNALQEHHARITPSLGGRPPRGLPEAWQARRAKYERWLADPDSFFVLARVGGEPIGYAFVTVGPGYASWATGDRIAELETISVLPDHRNSGVGEALLDAAWARLTEVGVDDLQITTGVDNVDSHRFYERQGLTKGFVVYYGRRGDS